jgi:glycosyltransferase involved in cell wall biosynthesis
MGLFSTLAVGKAFDVVLEAFDEIAAVYSDAELLLIGDLGQPGDRKFLALSRQIDACRARTRVHLTGKRPLDEVAQFVASLDLYLFPMSTGANTRSSTLPLALGAGVPVIAINGADTDPLFQHGRNVFFADALSGPAFARAALEVFADPALADRLAGGARELYDEQLTWTRIVDSLLADLA